MKVQLLGPERLDEVDSFYKNYGAHLRYPRKEWAHRLLEDCSLRIIGVLCNESGNEKMIGVAWVASKEHNIYLTKIGGALHLLDGGDFVDSGGWLVHPDHTRRGVFQLIAASVLKSWEEDFLSSGSKYSSLWGRMVSARTVEGVPLFWREVGTAITNLSYDELMQLPFGEMENKILQHWQREPLLLSGDMLQTWHEAAGKTSEQLISAEKRLNAWGFQLPENRYSATSLNKFLKATRSSVVQAIGSVDLFYRRTLQEVAG